MLTRKLRTPTEFFWLEGEFHIGLPDAVDLTHLRRKLVGIEFTLDT
jgi:hypothetical protein